MTAKPTFSVIVPAYNHEKYIADCIHSCFNQTVDPVDVIVVDDGSSDSTIDVARELVGQYGDRLKVHSNIGKGVAHAINYGVNHATGDCLAFIASDDMLLPNAIRIHVEQFSRDPGLELSISNGVVFDGVRPIGRNVHHGASRLALNWGRDALSFYISNVVPTLFFQSCALSRAGWTRIGGFPVAGLVDDWYFFYLAIQRTQLRYCFRDEATFLYRQHDTNVYKDVARQAKLVDEMVNLCFPQKKSHFESLMRLSSIRKISKKQESLRIIQTSLRNEPRSLLLAFLLKAASFVDPKVNRHDD